MSMKKEHFLLMKYFLQGYYQIIKSPLSLSVSQVVSSLLTKEELILIIEDMYSEQIHGHYDLQNLSTLDLLEIIGDDSYILSHIIDNWTWSEDMFWQKAVKQTLNELGKKKHYLYRKSLDKRTKLDYKTYQEFLKATWKPSARYAILPTNIKEEDYWFFADQLELYNTESEARGALFERYLLKEENLQELTVVAIE